MTLDRLAASLCLLAVCTAAPLRAQPAQGRLAAWIDTDPAVGVHDRDVDDGFALLQAFHSPELEIRGVSVVFGNAPLAQAWPIGRRIVGQFGPRGLHAYRGASSAAERGVETPASRALAAALEREPLIIFVLGPATNVATVLENHPELAPRIVRVIAVAGRRPGQRFTTGSVNRAGHRDFNLEQDPDAFRTLLAAPIPVTLTPFEVSSAVWMQEEDLAQLARGAPGVRSMVAPARRWLALWKRTFGVDGFNPFDTLAIARIVSPALLACEMLPASMQVLPDDVTEARMQGTTGARKAYLLVSNDFPRERLVEYCGSVGPAFKADLVRRLLRPDRAAR